VALAGIDVVTPSTHPHQSALAQIYFEKRKHKGITPEQAQAKSLLPHYFGALLVQAGHASGMVSGLNSETKPFLPAFEIIGLSEGMTRASSVFIMDWPDQTLFYADCSVNIAPDPATLAAIAMATAGSASKFGFEPRVAFLSFSTRDSAKHELVDRMKEAAAIARSNAPDLILDGEIQFDAAFVPEVAARKAPGSPFATAAANVFIFPDLNAGNIAYKITERLGGARAIGPLLQGLRRPINDVSRGCSVDDLVDVATMTAALA
jgi:phosphate acetyltransferase